MISLIRKIFLLLALSQLLTITNFSQNKVFLDLDLPFYNTELPHDFMIAPQNKIRKLKYYEVKKLYDDDHFGSYIEISKHYDTNGIPIDLKGKDKHGYTKGILINVFDSNYIVDSTFYGINDKGQLDSLVEYYRSGRTSSYSFYYDANGFCITSMTYSLDSLRRINHYKYDSKGRLIQKGNNTDFIHFNFDKERISEISKQEGENRFLKIKYIYDENERTRKTIELTGKDHLTEELYYDNKWRPAIKIRYGFRSTYNQNTSHIHNYEYNTKSELVRINVTYVKGNILSDKWEYEMKYNSKGDCIEEIMYDNKGKMLYKYRFIYEYYE